MNSVLIIDDDLEIRLVLTQILEHEGYTVNAVKNGREGLDFLENEQPNLIILDLMMPVMNGWEFQASVNAHPFLSKIPIVVLSAGGTINCDQELADPAAYIRKPVHIQELLKTVEENCRPAS